MEIARGILRFWIIIIIVTLFNIQILEGQGNDESYVTNDSLKSNVESLLLRKDDFKDIKAFIVKLHDEKDQLSKYIEMQFSCKTRLLLLTSAYIGTTLISDTLVDSLIKELNQLIKGENLYNEEFFKQVTLKDKIKKLIESKPEGVAVIYLNRLLLEAAYPDMIASSKTAENALDYLIGPVPTQQDHGSGGSYTQTNIPFWFWLFIGIISGGLVVYLVMRRTYSKKSILEESKHRATGTPIELDEVVRKINTLSEEIDSSNKVLSIIQGKLEILTEVSQNITAINTELQSRKDLLLRNFKDIEEFSNQLKEIPSSIKVFLGKIESEIPYSLLKLLKKEPIGEIKTKTNEGLPEQMTSSLWDDTVKESGKTLKLDEGDKNVILHLNELRVMAEDESIINDIDDLVVQITNENKVLKSHYQDISRIIVNIFSEKVDKSDKIWIRKLEEIAKGIGLQITIPSIGSSDSNPLMEEVMSLEGEPDSRLKQNALKNLERMQNNLTFFTVLYVVKPKIMYENVVMSKGKIIIYGKKP